MKRFILGGAACLALFGLPSVALAVDGADPAPTPQPEVVVHGQRPAFAGITDVWEANEDATLSDTLAGWAEREGWKLIWEPETDFRLAAGGQFEGNFEDAAQHLIEAFGQARPRIRATFYGGNKVLRVYVERAQP